MCIIYCISIAAKLTRKYKYMIINRKTVKGLVLSVTAIVVKTEFIRRVNTYE